MTNSMPEWKSMHVNIKHALEMEAKTYKYPTHITMIQEIIANAQDAFNEHNTIAPTIDISLRKVNGSNYILFHNNAKPIPKQFFQEKYHTIYESSKNVGQTIGFVGIGAKVFLASHDGAEIITITGNKEKLASAWRWTETGPQYVSSLDYPISQIVNLNDFQHTNGTTFICKLSPSQYSELCDQLEGIIHFWWNYALLSDMFTINIDGKKIKPKIPGTKKESYEMWVKSNRIKLIFYISKNELDEDYQNIVYTVHGKRIENEKLETALSVKDDFGSKIFCYADVGFMAKHVIKSKEGFEKIPYVSAIRAKVRSKF